MKRPALTEHTFYFNKKTFADYYGMSPYRFSVSLNEIKEEIQWKRGHQIFTPKQTERIIDFLGKP